MGAVRLQPPAAALLAALGAACGGSSSGDGSTGATGTTGHPGTTVATTATAGTAATTAATATGPGTATTGDATAATAATTGDPCDCPPGACPPECEAPLAPEVGFVEIEPVAYVLHADGQSQAFEASAARLWYGFQPADEDPQNKPLFVFFNGGPGAASEILFGFNTSQRSLDEVHNGGATVGPSPASWTSLGNLLYIDARVTGYSYNLMDDPSDDTARWAEFGTHNFNTYLDAADFVRVLLRFLAAHGAIRANPVILVGESYGGVRATTMLELLLNYEAHATDATPYEDPALVAEIQAHYDAVFPELAGTTVPPETIAEQFSHQILVQPLLLGSRQLQTTGQLHDAPGSVIFQIAADVGKTFVPCSAQGPGCDPLTNALDFVEQTAGRDRFAYVRPYNWLFERIDALGPKLSTVSVASEFFGVDVTAVPELYAAERSGAYRVPGTVPLVLPPNAALPLAAGPPPVLLSPAWSVAAGGWLPEAGDFPATFGDLAPYDAYYMPSNYVVLGPFYASMAFAYDIDPYDDRNAANFLRNVAYVETFVTNASWDLVIWGPAIPATMEQFPAYVAQVVHDTAGPAGAERPGQIVVDYVDGAFGLPAGTSRTIRMPYYDAASHTVPLDQPVELLADVADWLGG